MKTSFYLILLLGFVTSHLNAETNYVNKYNIHTTQKILNDKYCQKTKDNQTLCMEYQLEYPEKIQSDNKNLSQKIRENVQKYKESFQLGKAKEYIVDTLKDDDYGMSGTWSDEMSVNVFASTKNTFTLGIYGNSYMGGAHGNYAVGYDNYSIETGKKLRLDDLFVSGYKDKLRKITEKYYKKFFGAKASENLQNLGWFDNKFILANTFAITEEGLLFLYNSYEIKSYADGQTSFLLPYNTFTTLIKPKGILSSLASESIHNTEKQTKQIFNDAYGATFTVKSKNIDKNTVDLTIKVKNLTFQNRGWVSISFPYLTKKNHVKNVENTGFNAVHTYKRGSKIYHKQLKKAVKSKYLLVEGEAKGWKRNEEKTIHLTLHTPKNLNNLFLNIRAVFKGKGKDTTYVPDNYSDAMGQQGFANYRMSIAL